MSKTPSNPKLKAITAKAAEDLPAFIAEAEDKILEAWSQVEEEAQINETKPIFKLGLAISLDLDADKMETKLTFGVRHSLSSSCDIPDPSQARFDLDDKPGKKA